VVGGATTVPLLDRAIQARGGPLTSVVREVETDVEVGFPGRWRLRTAFLLPDRYAWTIETSAEPDHYLFDGHITRAFVGAREVSAVEGSAAPLASHARLFAVINLDALGRPGVTVTRLDDGALPAGAKAGLAVVLDDSGARYHLGFDDGALLVSVTGPVDLPPVGSGEVTVRFADFRRVGRLRLPFRATYLFGATVIAEERTLAICANDARLVPEAFQDPSRLPTCQPGSTGG
jgi:hypothetical protein